MVLNIKEYLKVQDTPQKCDLIVWIVWKTLSSGLKIENVVMDMRYQMGILQMVFSNNKTILHQVYILL